MPLIARIAIVFASGAITGSFLPAFSASVIVLSAIAALLWYFSREREPVVLLAFAITGVAFGCLHASRAKQPCVRYPDGASVQVAGVAQTRADATQRTIQMRADAGGCTVSMRVRLPDASLVFQPGDELRVAGTWMLMRVEIDERNASDGVLVASAAVRLPPGPHPLLRARGRVQQRIRILFPTAYSLAEALLISQREALNPEVKESFATSGLTHLLAISGSHVALVAATLLLFARLLRCSTRTAALVAVVGSAAYVFFLGAPYAAVRALIQMVLLLASRSMQRPAHPLGLLAAAAIVICALDPSAPLDAGFQLSFAGIAGIILWRRPLIDAMPASIPAVVRDAMATTCAATAVTTPIAAYHFGVVSVVALVANLLAGPVVAIAVPTAAAALAVSTISVTAARFLAGGSELALLWLYHIAHLCAAVPGGHFFVAPRVVLSSTLAFGIAYALMQGSYRSTVIGRSVTAVVAGALVLVAAPLVQTAGTTVQIHMIDVGQGDALAIRSPRGRWLLVDAGPRSETFDAGKARVVPFLLRHQADQILAVLLSHPHLDHFGGARSVIDRLRVGAVIDPGMPVTNPEFDSLIADAHRRATPWLAARAGTSLVMDGMRIDFLSPDSVALDGRADANDFSAAFRLTYGDFRALFLGDLYADMEQELIRRYGNALDVDLLKVAHHGSGGSSSPALLAVATPRLALVSAGRRNRYGHPNAGTLKRLRAAGATIFRSDVDGSVSVFATRTGAISVRTRQ